MVKLYPDNSYDSKLTQPIKNIIIRLPNWLGDLVMSTAFVKAVQQQYPDATIDLITKKGIDFLLDYFPPHGKRYVFDKTEYKGASGAWRFGRMLRKQKEFDLFFCLPDSMSSALLARATGANKIAGFKKEWRSFLLTHAYRKPGGMHRVEEYNDLLAQFTSRPATHPPVTLHLPATKRDKTVVININSEADSRRLPMEKARRIIDTIRRTIVEDIVLIGSPKEKDFVDEVFNGLADQQGIQNLAGKTTLPALVKVLGNSAVLLTTDSGPAHVANALGTHTIVLFGAGNENNTAPYNKENRTIIRLGKLSCEPCVSNTCVRFTIPECLLQLDEQLIAMEILNQLKTPAHVV